MINIRVVRQKGFTIVELLIVIVVIGILAATISVAYRGIQERGRDSIRLTDAKTIEKSLRIYQSQQGVYFGPTSIDGNWETSNEDGPGSFMEQLIASGTISKVPIDPKNNSTTHYRYYLYGAGSYGCDASKGQIAIFQIMDFESSGRPAAQSPGFSCSSRDWGIEADYTVGIFENG